MIRKPRQERSVAARNRILQAAICAFSERGFSGARMDAIAKEAGANKQLIYAYFGGKEALYREVMASIFTSVTESENAFISQCESNPAALTKGLIDGYAQLHRHHPHFWRLLAWNNLEVATAPQLPVAWKHKAYLRLEKIYRQAQSAGAAPQGCSFETYVFVLSAVTLFGVSNQRSMSVTLDLDLSKSTVQRRMRREMLAWLTGGREA